MFIEADGLFASKPAPTVIGVKHQFFEHLELCGSEPAREGARTATTNFRLCNIW
jgi:hypothetical protein